MDGCGCFAKFRSSKNKKKQNSETDLRKKQKQNQTSGPVNVMRTQKEDKKQNKQNHLNNNENSVRQSLLRKDFLSVIGYRMNPVFTQTRQYTFPSPFIKYKIIPLVDQKKALDKASRNNELKSSKQDSMIIWDYHGGPNQLYYLRKLKNNQYYIINVAKAFTVEVPESSTGEGVQIYANPRNDKDNQWWELQPTNIQDSYQIKSFCGKYLTAEESYKGSKVVQAQRTGQKNQKWKIIPS